MNSNSLPLSLYLVLATLLLFGCKKDVDKTKPTVGPISESVYASGVVKADQQYVVYPTVSGILKKKLVEPGTLVEVGQDLFLIENNTSVLNTENAELAYQLARDNASPNSTVLKDLKLNVELAASKLSFDSSMYFRQKELWAQNVGTKNELEQKQLAYETSLKSYEAAKNKLKQTRIQLQNELQRTQNNLRIGQKQTRDYTIKSEVKGKIFDILKEEGELLTLQTPIAVLGEANRFLLEFQIDELDIIRIKTGQLVKVTMDSYKGKVFEAYITKIYPIMNEGTRTFKVEAAFKEAPATLYPNLTAEANIIIQTKNNALLIPAAYLVDEQFVLTGKKEKTKVSTGLKDYQYVEITGGLDSSTYIYLPKQ